MTAQFGGHKARGQDRAYVSPSKAEGEGRELNKERRH